MKAVTISIAKKLAYVFAVLVIIAAVLVLFSRVYIPALEKYKPEFEKWASDSLKAPVTIEKARFSWYRYQPEISLYNVTLYSPKSHKRTLHVKRLRLFISIPASLWERKLVFGGMMLSGAEINVIQKKSGELVAKELQQFEGEQESTFAETKVTDILAWLVSQPRLMLKNIDLHYRGLQGQKRYVTFKHLRLDNEGDAHTLLARALLHQKVPTEVSLVIRGIGDVSEPLKMGVKGYIYFSGLSLPQWLQQASWHDWLITKGIGSAKIWFNWENGAMQDVQSIFQLYNLTVSSSKLKVAHHVKRLSADLGWRREGDEQVLAADDVLVDMNQHLWPVSNFYLKFKPDSHTVLQPRSLNVGYFNISDVLGVLKTFPTLLPNDLKQIINKTSPTGNINGATIEFPHNANDWHKARYQFILSDVNVHAFDKLPGIKNLTARLSLNNNHVGAVVESKNLEVTYDRLFDYPLWFTAVEANADFNWDEHAWTGNIKHLKAYNNAIHLTMNGAFHQKDGESPEVDLRSSFYNNSLKDLYRLLPMKVFDKGLVDWLKVAFTTGRTRNGNVVLKGNLKDFPFSDGGGKFNITTDVKDVNLHYADGWPDIKQIEGKVEFIGDRINIAAPKATVTGIDVHNITASIPELGAEKGSVVDVEVQNIATTFPNGMRFINTSPLVKTIGAMFKDMSVSGPISVDLSMSVPFSDGSSSKINGDLHLDNAGMSLVPWRLQLEHVNGTVHFTEDTITASKIFSTLFNKPFNFSLKTIEKGKHSIIRANTDYNLDVKDLETWLNVPLSKLLTGAADVKSEIDLSMSMPVNIALQSDLKGVKVDLPPPYNKPANKSIAFKANLTVPENKPTGLKLYFGDRLGAAMRFSNKQRRFALSGVNLHLGKGNITWPKTDGLYITGSLDKLNMKKIQSYATGSASNSYTDLPLKEIKLKVGKLSLFGQDIANAGLTIIPQESAWKALLKSKHIVGYLVIPAPFSPRGRILARFDKMDLDLPDENFKANISVSSLPSIDFLSDDVAVNDIFLGRIKLNMIHQAKGMAIKALTLSSPFMHLDASGQWTLKKGKPYTRLSGVLKTNNVSQLLDEFEFDLDNFIATKGDLKFNLSWVGAPYAPALSQLNGSATLNIGSGRIVDVAEASGAKMDLGRLLSIFSLQTLPRRLSLDFSDLAEKGYSFDSLQGKFKFKNGNVYTNDALFEGPVAAVGIKGRVGVAKKDINMKLKVTPHVTSSLPVAATLVGGPVAGLAAFAVNSVVNAAVSTVASYQYSVNGSWHNPIWTEIKQKGLKKRR